MKTLLGVMGILVVGAVGWLIGHASAPQPQDPGLLERLDGIEARLDGVTSRLDRSPQPEPAPMTVAPDGDSGSAAPGSVAQPKPKTPAPTPTPEARRWLDALGSTLADDRFKATIELARLGSPAAIAPLIHSLDTDRDFYVRLGAATALGEMRAADGVPMLIEHLTDADELVRTACAEALRRIGGHSFNFVGGIGVEERQQIQGKWRTWWGENEKRVRSRLGRSR